ncbi:jg11446 [Pararge aegeria aegeria]|uniref:Jg11446 protein n=1 Tax=Pararge aegeria aegeria TaxID=348720 RepID=A0A8S4RVM8_9NEOP|nr:jg11446 [Pararge aegeria aegeria]
MGRRKGESFTEDMDSERKVPLKTYTQTGSYLNHDHHRPMASPLHGTGLFPQREGVKAVVHHSGPARIGVLHISLGTLCRTLRHVSGFLTTFSFTVEASDIFDY